ncbi:ATP-binding cassette domain-containing protein [Pseudomonas vancouverensis]|uniref:ATP-binding cassette domain-containing protein n=1 Tax=Pseudomonas vancouverensis TaxID=95300 RepID=A0A1H2NJV9_PSEVA|nr:ATP-binding cassette domain-containing protein [Pseudomonas vancouverensis]KAB0495144.1 ATP-binding cassette domain-containing protein [Pseudomonas vancouverensis]TDB57095.1 ATP-binding cassette domain-containing protein [Pseudomonas vancouverensis]SDV05723.1 ATP-binding cassette, subfamily B/ATP-binding cassette, subfamily B, RtxE [Pseudomonas vancouverensis]
MQTLIKTACKKHAALLAVTITTIIALKIISLGPPLLLGKVVDTLNDGNQAALYTLLLLIAGFVLAGCIQAVIMPLQIFLLSKLVQHIVMNASIGWVVQLMRKEFLQFSSWRIGHFIKSVERGFTAHEHLLTFFITIGLPLCLEFIIIGGVFAYMGGAGIFFAMTALGMVYLFVTHWIIRWRRKHINAVNEQEDELSAVLFSTMSTGKAIKLEGAERTAAQPLNTAFQQYAQAAITVAGSGGILNAAKILFVSLSTGGLLLWGALDQLTNESSISVGQLVAIFSIAGSFLLNITALTEGYRILDQFLADQRRLQQLLSLPNFDDNRQAEIVPQSESSLVLEPCAVTDNGINRLSIASTITLTQGQSVAITGPSGAGKSTLMEVLAGIYAPTRKQLSIDGTPVIELSGQSHLDTLRYCPQSPQFLAGFFDHSVLFGAPPSPHLTQAIRRLNLEEIARHRSINENASNISGGEAKRLSLLRLINRPGRFNLFDEPTSSIEPKLASPVWDLLFDCYAGRGLICVTHDVGNLYRFDRVIVMQNGVIIDDGPWCDLVNRAAIKLLLSDLQTRE